MSSGVIQVDDLSHLGSFNTNINMSDVYSTVHQYNWISAVSGEYERRCAMVRVIGIKCKNGQEAIAARVISKIVNHIQEFTEDEDNPIKGFLGPKIAKIQLAITGPSVSDQMVMSYVALTTMGELILDEDFEFMARLQNTHNAVTLEEIDDLLKN